MPTPLSNEQLDLCTQLLHQLERTGPEHFSMGTWFESDTDDIELMLGDTVLRDSSELTKCGTRACIAGHAALLVDPVVIEWPTNVDFQTNVWTRHDAVRRKIAELLGFGVDLPVEDFTAESWFTSSWPKWAEDMQAARFLKHVSAGLEVGEAASRAEFDTVVSVLDDIVHGVRANWWDGAGLPNVAYSDAEFDILPDDDEIPFD